MTTEEMRAKAREYRRLWRAAHPDKVAEANAKTAYKRRLWRKDNPDAAKIADAKRYAQLKSQLQDDPTKALEYRAKRWKQQRGLRDRITATPEGKAAYNAAAAARNRARYANNAEFREERRQYNAEYHAANREWNRVYQREWTSLQRAKRFGLSIEQYEALRPRLDGPCEICGAMGRMVFDHNHTTHQFRGLLCRSCNVGIGHLRDDPDHLRKAIAYLERSLSERATQ